MMPMRLVGDEDCGVSLVCNICDTEGKPEAYYEGICGNPYPDVPSVGSIQELAEFERRHLWECHRYSYPSRP
jgi:hypothetical protein